MGRHCRAVTVPVRVGETEDHEAYFDAVATWLLGHTERIEFSELYEDEDEDDILVDATIHVPCRFLEEGKQTARCKAHGYRTKTTDWEPYVPANRQLGENTMELIVDNRLQPVHVSAPQRSLNVIRGENPCATARCRTSDNKLQAACCRDLILEVELPKRARHREALVRSRKTPYVCEFDRIDDETVEIHMISACSFLDRADGVTCVLHGKYRPNRRVAKPFLCTKWPDDPTNTHRGCAFAKDSD